MIQKLPQFIKRISWSLSGIILAIVLLFSQGFEIPVIDKKADTYFSESISKAGLAYATCRLINASVSVIQNSNIDLAPAGVGVSLALGQALDPIDDMAERLSDVLVTAIVSLGIQKLIYEISVSFTPKILCILLITLSILIWLKGKQLESFQKVITKITFIVIVLRLCLPVSSIANDFLHKHFFETQIIEAKDALSISAKGLDEVQSFSLPEIDGVLGTIKNSSVLLMEKSLAFKNALESIINNMQSVISNLVTLTTLYVGIFLIQVIILPLTVFWLLIKLINSLFNKNLPVIMKHPRPLKEEREKTLSKAEI